MVPARAHVSVHSASIVNVNDVIFLSVLQSLSVSRSLELLSAFSRSGFVLQSPRS